MSDTLDLIICKLKARKLGILHLDVDGKKGGGRGEIIRGEYTWFKPVTNEAQIAKRCVKAAHFCRSCVNFAFAN